MNLHTRLLINYKTSGILTFIVISLMALSLPCQSQIGYQVALINNATGEPRALETVSVDLTISNSEGKTILSETQSATTNDFGILSLSVGNTNTFKNVDWSKHPLYISATVDGILIGKTQILSVPVAEYAKATGVLTMEKLCSKTWSFNDDYYSFSFAFNDKGSGTYDYILKRDGKIERQGSYSLKYSIQGNTVCAVSSTGDSFILCYLPETDSFSVVEGRHYQ